MRECIEARRVVGAGRCVVSFFTPLITHRNVNLVHRKQPRDRQHQRKKKIIKLQLAVSSPNQAAMRANFAAADCVLKYSALLVRSPIKAPYLYNVNPAYNTKEFNIRYYKFSDLTGKIQFINEHISTRNPEVCSPLFARSKRERCVNRLGSTTHHAFVRVQIRGGGGYRGPSEEREREQRTR